MRKFRKALKVVYVIPFILLAACEEKENEAPSVKIATPERNAILMRGDVVPIKAIASDEDGSIKQMSIFIEGEEVAESEETTLIYFWNTAGIEVKEYAIGALAADNEDELASVNITVLLGAEGGLNPDLDYDTVSDIDGNMYATIALGTQVWMAENLKVTHYPDGTPISEITDEGEWNALAPDAQAFCWYNNQMEYQDTSGVLYTWAAAMNGGLSNDTIGVQGVCPDGWHLPADAEWKILEIYLGMTGADADKHEWRGDDEGGQLKEEGFSNWDLPNAGASNSSGFTAVPGGFRSVKGLFYNIDTYAAFWTATEEPLIDKAWYRTLNHDREDIYRQYNNMQLGLSVRCLKDQ